MMSEFAISKKMDKECSEKVISKDRTRIQIYVNSKVTKMSMKPFILNSKK